MAATIQNTRMETASIEGGASLLGGLRAALTRRRVYLDTLTELRSLDARQLADIGVAPDQIDAVAAACAAQATRAAR